MSTPVSIPECLRLMLHDMERHHTSMLEQVRRLQGELQEQCKDILPPPVPLLHLSDREQDSIRRALAHCGSNRKKASEMLGLSERTLYRKLKIYGIS